MAIRSNSYGSVSEVEALVPRYCTDNGHFGPTSRPSLTQVEKFIDRVSGLVNILLAEEGFAIPVTQADAKLALDDFVVAQSAQLAHAVNGAGPFAPGNEEFASGKSPFQIITKEAADFINKHADGLAALGASRTRSLTDGLACRTTDDAGDDIHPMFQRKQFSNVVEDWDTDE